MEVGYVPVDGYEDRKGGKVYRSTGGEGTRSREKEASERRGDNFSICVCRRSARILKESVHFGMPDAADRIPFSQSGRAEGTV